MSRMDLAGFRHIDATDLLVSMVLIAAIAFVWVTAHLWGRRTQRRSPTVQAATRALVTDPAGVDTA